MTPILTGVAPFFGVIALGALCARLGLLSAEHGRGLNAFVFYVAMPSLVFATVVGAPQPTIAEARFAGGYAVALLVQWVLVWIIARHGAARPAPASAAQALAAAAGNTTFLGLPLTLAVFGDSAATAAAIVVLIDNLVLMPAAVTLLIAASGARPARAALVHALNGAARNPIIISAFAGIIVAAFALTPPTPVAATIDMMARAASPVALFALGAMVAQNIEAVRRTLRPAWATAAAKTLAFPAVVFGVLTVADVDPTLRAIGVIMAGAPTAVNVFVQASAYRVSAVETTAAVAASTALSVVTLSALVSLFAP